MSSTRSRFFLTLVAFFLVQALFIACQDSKELKTSSKKLDQKSNPMYPKEEGCRVKIVYLPQIHANDVSSKHPRLSSDSIDEIASSQFKIANYIKNNPTAPVFSEQAGQTISMKGPDKKRFEQAIEGYKKTFPQGLPALANDLNDEQKKILAKNGGDSAALMLGLIDSIHGVTESSEIQSKMLKEIKTGLSQTAESRLDPDSELYKKIFDEREKLALEQIKKYVMANPKSKSVTLIFGALHDFRRHSDIIPSECYETPDEFVRDIRY